MKNKKLTYILVFAVLIIWILIFKQIFGFMGNNNSDIPAKSIIPNKQGANIKSDTVILIADYPDPFKEKNNQYRKPATSKNTSKKREKKVAESIVLPVKWPVIEFEGIIRSDKKTLGLLYINETQHIVSEEETYDEVLVKSIHKDSVVTVYKNQLKTFYK